MVCTFCLAQSCSRLCGCARCSKGIFHQRTASVLMRQAGTGTLLMWCGSGCSLRFISSVNSSWAGGVQSAWPAYMIAPLSGASVPRRLAGKNATVKAVENKPQHDHRQTHSYAQGIQRTFGDRKSTRLQSRGHLVCRLLLEKKK